MSIVIYWILFSENAHVNHSELATEAGTNLVITGRIDLDLVSDNSHNVRNVKFTRSILSKGT